MNITRIFGKKIFDGYVDENFSRVFACVEKNKNARFLDLGCGAGGFTLEIAKKIGTKEIYGAEVVSSDIKKAKKNRIKCRRADLNKRLPYKNDEFDVILSHFSIEHLYNVGGFVKECHRILKNDGYMLIASDNLNSWLNIIAMILTFQPFSLTRGLAGKAVGNPYAYWTDSDVENFVKREKETDIVGAGSHIKVMSVRAAKEVAQFYGFKIDKLYGAGYFPFWGTLSKFFSKVDPHHSHFYILKLKK